MTEEEKREMMKKIKKMIDEGFCNTVKVTMDESEKRLNQVAEMPEYNYVNVSLVSDINVKYEDS